MEQTTIQQTIASVGEILTKGGYAKNSVYQFNSTTDQLLKYMDSAGIVTYSTEVGIRFLEACYGFDPNAVPSRPDSERLRYLRKLSEYQLHGAVILKRNMGYDIPEAFRKATNAFLAYRRFVGIVERNMSTISLYLERYFRFLTSQGVRKLPDISGAHIHGYLRFITGYSNQTKGHMMRTVRQFMSFCFKNGYHPEDLSSYAPHVRYDKRARLPSAYSCEDVIN